MLFYSIRSRKISQKWDKALKLLNHTSLICLLCPLHPPLFAPSQPSGSPNRPAAPPKPLTKKQTKLYLYAMQACHVHKREKNVFPKKGPSCCWIICVKTHLLEKRHTSSCFICAIKAVEVVKTQRRRKIFQKGFHQPSYVTVVITSSQRQKKQGLTRSAGKQPCPNNSTLCRLIHS